MKTTVVWLDKRAMDAIEHHQRTRELNSIVHMRRNYPKFTPFEHGHFNCAGKYVIPNHDSDLRKRSDIR